MKKFVLKDIDSKLIDSEHAIDVEFVLPSHSNLEQVLEQFTLFLKACGYHFDGYCDIIDFDDLK